MAFAPLAFATARTAEGLPNGLDAPGICELLNARKTSIVAVRGNCDSEVDQMLLEKSADGTLCCNPGSPTFPKGGNPPTFAVYENKTITVFTLDGEVLRELS